MQRLRAGLRRCTCLRLNGVSAQTASASSAAASGERWRARLRWVVRFAGGGKSQSGDRCCGHRAGVFLDPVDDPVGTAPSGVAAGEGPGQRRANAVGVDREGGSAELQYRGCDGLREPLGDRAPRGRLKPDLVALCGFGGHAPLARRLARSWRTVARSTPGSPRPRTARLAEIRATASVSARISKVISRPSRSSTDSRTASASPLRVRVIRSRCCRTRLASSERRALASDSGMGVAAIVVVRNTDPIGQFPDQSMGAGS